MKSLLSAFAIGLTLWCNWAVAADLKVFSTTALTELWPELKPKFEARGHKLNLVLEPSGALNKRILGGEAGDAIVSVSASVDVLVKGGKADTATVKALASSGMAVAVLKGAPKPDISTPEAFRAALLAAKSVAYSDPAGGGASGVYFAKLLEQLGIAQQVNAKAKLGRGIPNADFVIKGESDIAIQQLPELMTVKGVDIVGPFPAALDNVTGFSAAVLASSGNAAAARALVDYLAAPETIALLRSHGFSPAR
jgi:molybdate transport system substrate-binding protein